MKLKFLKHFFKRKNNFFWIATLLLAMTKGKIFKIKKIKSDFILKNFLKIWKNFSFEVSGFCCWFWYFLIIVRVLALWILICTPLLGGVDFLARAYRDSDRSDGLWKVELAHFLSCCCDFGFCGNVFWNEKEIIKRLWETEIRHHSELYNLLYGVSFFIIIASVMMVIAIILKILEIKNRKNLQKSEK